MLDRVQLKYEAKAITKNAKESAYVFTLIYLAIGLVLDGIDYLVSGSPQTEVYGYLADYMPEAAVYLVLFSLRARMQASLMLSGVGKSGSPAPKPTTSMPWAFIFLYMESMAMVEDAWTASARVDSGFMQIRSFILIQMSHTFLSGGYYSLPRRKMQEFFLCFSEFMQFGEI